jgi:hypothetical protein
MAFHLFAKHCDITGSKLEPPMFLVCESGFRKLVHNALAFQNFGRRFISALAVHLVGSFFEHWPNIGCDQLSLLSYYFVQISLPKKKKKCKMTTGRDLETRAHPAGTLSECLYFL